MRAYVCVYSSYVEAAHGTGTKARDPLEAVAIHAVICRGRHRAKSLYLGSVRSNIGYLETACGFAAIIKVALCSINLEVSNENIPFDELNIEVQVYSFR